MRFLPPEPTQPVFGSIASVLQAASSQPRPLSDRTQIIQAVLHRNRLSEFVIYAELRCGRPRRRGRRATRQKLQESAWRQGAKSRVGRVPPAYAAQHALVAAPPPGAAWGAVPPAYAPQHALVAAPYGFPPVAAPAVPPPPYPAVAPDNALTALERALAPKVEPTPAFLELERWVEAHVANVERRRSVLDAAESLEDLKACDAEELEEILDLNTWPRLARQRFLGAWRELKGEAQEEEEVEEGALVPFALPTFAVGALVDADFQARRPLLSRGRRRRARRRDTHRHV